MKKNIKILTVAAAGAVVVVIGAFLFRDIRAEVRGVDKDTGISDIYSKEDRSSAISAAEEYFNDKFKDCKLYSLSYSGDVRSSNENNYLDQYKTKKGFEDIELCECIVLDSQFRIPVTGGDVWYPYSVYDWSWTLAREENGQWYVVNYGAG